MASRSTIGIREVGPREALQAHQETLPTDRKIELIDALLAAGVTKLNAVSLVSPRGDAAHGRRRGRAYRPGPAA